MPFKVAELQVGENGKSTANCGLGKSTRSVATLAERLPTAAVLLRRSGAYAPRDRRGLRIIRSGHDFHGGGACSCADHRFQVRTRAVLGPIGRINAIVDRTINGFKNDLLSHARRVDSADPLMHCCLMPAGLHSVVATHIEVTVNRNRPDPSRRAVRMAVVTKR